VLTALIREIRVVEAALGDGVKRPRPSEQAVSAVARRSLHAARALSRGTRLTADDLISLRPGTGMPPSAADRVIGRSLKRALGAGEMLSERDID
jgi:sialic acid synthase SpsE